MISEIFVSIFQELGLNYVEQPHDTTLSASHSIFDDYSVNSDLFSTHFRCHKALSSMGETERRDMFAHL